MFATENLFKQYESLIDRITIISKTNPEGIISYANDKFCEISGYSRDELLGKPHNIVRHPDMPKEVFANMWDTIKNKKQTWEGVIKNRKKGGGYYWVMATISPILDKEGNIIEYISIRKDITKLKDSIKIIEDYKNILDQNNLLIILDKNGIIKYANKSFCNISNYKDNEIIGRKYVDFISENGEIQDLDNVGESSLNKKNKKLIINDFKKNKNWKGNIKNKGKIGNIFYTSTNIIPITDYDGNIKEFYCILSDTTDNEIAKNLLKKSINKLKEVDQKKDDFLNIASHELRTPMTSIKGYLSMIIDGDIGNVDYEAKTYLTKIYDNVENLLGLTNDMLDISKMESGKMEFVYEKFELKSLILDIIRDMEQIANNKNTKIEKIISYDDLIVNLDKIKLRQVIVNIIGNAIKYTANSGLIILKSFVKKGNLYISIKDNGIGIDKKDIHKIFSKFGQVRNSYTREIGGTGLGLPIVKNIINHFKGSIKLKSKVGEGSEFIIILPLN